MACAGVLSCGTENAPTTPNATSPPTVPTVAAAFELLGGYRLQVDFASEGLGLVQDASGLVVEAVAGAHAQTGRLNVYDLRQPFGGGSDPNAYPVLSPLRSWGVTELFPHWLAGQNLRDVTVVSTSAGYELAGIGRVYYNTSPRLYTQISIRELRGNGTALGATREMQVDLPEQELSGFIKHADSRTDLTAVGAGAYDSGQGSVGGLSYAVRQPSGTWTRLLNPPGFGDVTSPRLPRDAEYSCTDGTSWVCIPPVNGKGVWSTERIGGGGVRYGNTVLFIAMLGYGDRSYNRQTYTFGDPSLDRAVAYFFAHDKATGTVTFAGYDRWVFANPGEPVIGVALGRVSGYPDPLLFVVKSMAWHAGAYKDGSVLQVFRIRPQ